jgi:hypothetical protein
VRTIIFHEPALASVFAGVTAGKTSVEGRSLLQLELENAKRIEAAIRANLGKALGFEVVGFEGLDFRFMEWLAFRRGGCT